MSPELVWGPYGAIVCLVFAVLWLSKRLDKSEQENDALRDSSLELLKKYQARDDEERRWQVERERKRSEAPP
jgi:hypothetical protein